MKITCWTMVAVGALFWLFAIVTASYAIIVVAALLVAWASYYLQVGDGSKR